eukprot:760432-Hanusia_phi.AAC.3
MRPERHGLLVNSCSSSLALAVEQKRPELAYVHHLDQLQQQLLVDLKRRRELPHHLPDAVSPLSDDGGGLLLVAVMEEERQEPQLTCLSDDPPCAYRRLNLWPSAHHSFSTTTSKPLSGGDLRSPVPPVAAVDQHRGSFEHDKLRDPPRPLQELRDVLQPVRLLHVLHPPLVVVGWRGGAQLAQARVGLADGVDVLDAEEHDLALLVRPSLVPRGSEHRVGLRVGVRSGVDDVERSRAGVSSSNQPDQALVLLVAHAEQARKRLSGAADDAVSPRTLPHHDGEAAVGSKLQGLLDLPVADPRGDSDLPRVRLACCVLVVDMRDAPAAVVGQHTLRHT